MQICSLGLGTCDAKMSMMKALPNAAAQHDNFPQRFLIGNPHDKLRFSITKEVATFVGYAIQISQEC